MPAFAMMRDVSVSGEVSEAAEVEVVACIGGWLTLRGVKQREES